MSDQPLSDADRLSAARFMTQPVSPEDEVMLSTQDRIALALIALWVVGWLVFYVTVCP